MFYMPSLFNIFYLMAALFSCKNLFPCFQHSPLYFLLSDKIFKQYQIIQEHLKSSSSKCLEERNLILLWSAFPHPIPPETLRRHFSLYQEKATAFSKARLIKQSAVQSLRPAAVVRLVSAPLPLLVRFILFVLARQKHVSLSEQICTFTQSKEKQHFTVGEGERC